MVKSRKRKVVFVADAENQFEELLSFLKRESPIGMRIVRDAILLRVKQLPMHPFMHEEDSLCDDNDGSVRFFTVYHVRISYQVADNLILIIRIRHTSREPLNY